MTSFAKRLAALAPGVLTKLSRGIEKESLRVNPDGTLATTPHPKALGAALTHPHITTDFSESQLELITGVHTTPQDCLQQLVELHQFVYRNIGDELLWATSMPCALPPEDEIPIGQYGSSNIGRLKTAYRNGLSHRYGRRMQTISGIHYNFSLPSEAWPALKAADEDKGSPEAYQDRSYFSLIRNFRRDSWLLLLFLGSSPAVCQSFLGEKPRGLVSWDSGTYIAPHGTSLRMGRLGYQSDAQSSLAVSFNSLEQYAVSLNRALTEPYPPYEAIGIGEPPHYRQLATSLLQIENEFYSKIRPKRRIRPGERALRALGERGVEYVEVRLVDVNPFHPVGISADDMRLLDVFLLHCLLRESPADSPEELAAISQNQQLVAERGRDPDLRLDRDGTTITLAHWCLDLLRECEPIADALDAAHGGTAYRDIVAVAENAVRHPDTLPSASVLNVAERDYEKSFVRFALAQSHAHRAALLSRPFPDDVGARYAALAEKSLEAQQQAEAADALPVEEYRVKYLNQDLLSGPHLHYGD